MTKQELISWVLFNADVLYGHDLNLCNALIVYALSKYILKTDIPNYLNYNQAQVDEYMGTAYDKIKTDEEFRLWSGVLVKNINTELSIKSTYL